MARPWGPGPVFVFESLVAARKWGYYAGRSAFALALLVALWFAWVNLVEPIRARASSEGLNRAELARLGEAFYQAIAGVQVSLILLAAPAATAGAVCLDRARGTLAHVLVTDLSDAEVVLGKLGARLIPVLALVATAAPVVALAGLLGGVVPGAVVTLFLVSAALAVLGCALALAVSVRVGKPHEVLMVVYATFTVWLLSHPVWVSLSGSGFVPLPPRWFAAFNPYILVYAPLWPSGLYAAGAVALFLVFVAGASAALVVWSVATLRRDVRSGAKRSERWEGLASWVRSRLFSWWPNPSLDGNPVLWREWHRNRPSRTARRVWAVYAVGAVAVTAWGFANAVKYGVTQGSRSELLILDNAFQVALGLLFLSATAPTALMEERTRGSLDVLLATPLSTRSIVLAKWWAVFRVAPRLAILPGLAAFLIAAAAEAAQPPWLRGGAFPLAREIHVSDRVAAAVLPVAWVLAHGAAIASVGVALATWIARPGRAIAASVALYLAATVVWIFAVELVAIPVLREFLGLGRGRADIEAVEGGLISFSPFGGQIVSLVVMVNPWNPSHRGLLWAIQFGLLGATVAFAGGLLLLTIVTFNRCLGRVDEMPSAAPPGWPGTRPKSYSPERYASSSSPFR
jgi:ABC-type transport system involved in multi-copper enzyme maturation permease subunit